MSDRALDGTKLYEPQTGLLIPFKSYSDALLAQLPLQSGMSKQHFNLLLDILLDPSFSLDELNLKSATDIDVRISDYRRELAEARSIKVFSELGTGVGCGVPCSAVELAGVPENLEPSGMPSLVFDLVLDQLLSEADHFSHEADSMTQTPSPEVAPLPKTEVLQTALKTVSLVHRTWTEPSQRALHRRIILTSRRSLHGFARSPACGTGVRELAYKIPQSETCTFFHEASVAREHWCTLASVISRLSALRYLCISIESAHLADLSGLELVLDAVEGLKNLEGLWLHTAKDHCPYLLKLCLTVSRLPNLRFLSIWNWTCPRRPGTSARVSTDSFEMREEILSLTPPPSLKALQIRDDYLTTPPVYLSWLFQPRKSYSLSTLDLHITFSRPLPLTPLDHIFPNREANYTTPRTDSSHLLSAIAPLLPTLTTLAIKLFYLDTSTTSGACFYDTDIQAILSLCTCLKRLRLHRLRAGTHVDGVRLPMPRPTHVPSPLRQSQVQTESESTGGEEQSRRRPNAPLILPSTLEELHLHYAYSAINWRTQEHRLVGTLRASELPHLKRVFVSNGDTDLEGGKGRIADPDVDLPKTSELCKRLGVQLIVGDARSVHRYVEDSLS